MKDDAGALAVCLAALARQTLPADEVIVVDNGSSDDSAEVARRWGACVVVELEPGIPAACAAGYDRARNAFIARLDADSVPPADWIARAVARLDSEAELSAVTGPGIFYDGPRRGSRLLGVLYMGLYFWTVGVALAGTSLFGSAFVMRQSAWVAVRRDVHRTGTHIHDDIDLAFHLTGAGHVDRIAFDRELWVGISARPLLRPSTLPLRIRRGVRTIVMHWPDDSPLVRYRRRFSRPGAPVSGQ